MGSYVIGCTAKKMFWKPVSVYPKVLLMFAIISSGASLYACFSYQAPARVQ